MQPNGDSAMNIHNSGKVELTMGDIERMQNRIAELEQENAGLLAQAEQLRSAAEQLLNADDAGDRAAIHDKLNELILKTPAQCLAQVKAGALLAEAMLWPEDKYTECSHVRESLLESAEQILQGVE
jgi:hypothetical protein